MQAGELWVDIQARLENFEKGIEQVRNTSVTAGDQAGAGFSARFGRQWSNFAQGQLNRIAGPMFAAGVADGLANAIKSEKGWMETITDGIKSIPFVGSFVGLGEAIGEATYGGFMEGAERAHAEWMAGKNSMLGQRRMAAEEQDAIAKRQSELGLERQRLELATKYAALKAQDPQDATRQSLLDLELKREQLKFDLQFKLAKALTVAEKDQLYEIHQLEMDALAIQRREIQANAKERRDAEAQRIAEQEEKQAAADRRKFIADIEAADLAADQAEAELEFQRRIVGLDEDAVRAEEKKRDDTLRALERERAIREAGSDEERALIERRYDAEQEIADLRANAASATNAAERASIEQGSTALGTFKFETYPAARQKDVQERTMRATEQTADAVKSLAMNTGFS